MGAFPFDSIMRLSVSCKDQPDKVLTYKVDDSWWFAVNGNKEPRSVTIPGGWGACDVPGFHAIVAYNGWLAGIFTPMSGEFAAGSNANPDLFDAAITKHLEAKTHA